jgi:nicotinamidase-related amidase
MKALLVIDMQVQCFTGLPPRRDEVGTVSRINALAKAVRPKGAVVFVQHADPAEGFAYGCVGWQLLPALDVDASDASVGKQGCDAFLETDLDSVLKGKSVDELIIVGCATDFCVDTTVRSATAHGYSVTVVSDAHTTRDRPHLDAAKIIEHHNFMWADLLLPRQKKVRLIATASLITELQNA